MNASLNTVYPNLQDAIAKGLEAYKPVIAEDFVRYTSFWLEDVQQQLGAAMVGVYNSRFARMWMTTVKPLCETFAIDESQNIHKLHNTGYRINAEKQARIAAEFAEAVVIDSAAKIAAKIGAVESLEVGVMDADGRFTVRGTFQGKTVALRQIRVMKSSTRGVLFYQWPATIYVDGKKMSEVQFKKLVAAATAK